MAARVCMPISHREKTCLSEQMMLTLVALEVAAAAAAAAWNRS